MADRPVVLIYVSLPGSGEVRGGPRSVLLTARHLSRYRPVFVLNRESAFADDVRSAGLAAEVLPIARVLDGFREADWKDRLGRFAELARHDLALLATARRHGAVVVHCQDPSEVITVGAFARLAGRSVVFHMRSGPRKTRLRLPKLMAISLATRSICVSSQIRESYLAASPSVLQTWVARRTVSIPNGIDLEEVARLRAVANRMQSRASLGVDDGARVLTVVGALYQDKNQLAFLRQAAERILALAPNVRLLFVGSDRSNAPYAEQCRQVARALPGSDRITFVGEVPHRRMADVYASTDVLLIPSALEGLPRVALEAQAWGIPVVATRIPGNQAAIIEGTSGLFVGPGSLELYADAVRLLFDPRTHQTYSHGARRHIEEHFDVRVLTQQIEVEYDRARGIGQGSNVRRSFRDE